MWGVVALAGPPSQGEAGAPVEERVRPAGLTNRIWVGSQGRDLDLQVGVHGKTAEDRVQLIIGFDIEHGVVGVFPNHPPDGCQSAVSLNSLGIFFFKPLQASNFLDLQVRGELDVHAGKKQHLFLSVGGGMY